MRRSFFPKLVPEHRSTHASSSSAQQIRVGCPAHNCGGRCLLIAHVQNGRIIRLDTDDRPDSLAAPQLRACPRGRAYLRFAVMCGENKNFQSAVTSEVFCYLEFTPILFCTSCVFPGYVSQSCQYPDHQAIDGALWNNRLRRFQTAA